MLTSERPLAPPLYGVVLAGGMSRRMGREKWRLEYRGAPHAVHLHALLEAHVERAFVSVRPAQEVEPELAHLPLIVDAYRDMGPLGGILSALAVAPDAAWLVLACDLPLVDDATIARLVAQRAPQRLATAYRSRTDGGPEPLCAIYEPRARARLLDAAGWSGAGPRALLLDGDVTLLDAADEHELLNVNQEHEHHLALRLLRSRKAGRSVVKHVSIEYFAVLREHRRVSSEDVSTTATTAAELYQTLREEHALPLAMSSLRVAVNDEFSAWDRRLEDGDRVAFIPPVAGG